MLPQLSKLAPRSAIGCAISAAVKTKGIAATNALIYMPIPVPNKPKHDAAFASYELEECGA